MAEGFGLTVTEAMWKARAVMASRVGGIQDQIDDGQTGVLFDPTNHEAFARPVLGLLEDPQGSAAIGARAQAQVRRVSLGSRHLTQWLELCERLIATSGA